MAETLTFDSHGTRCAATLYLPDGSGPFPCLVMGHGFTGTQDQLEPYAVRFAEVGIAVLTFDYRHFGRSEGEPRQLVDGDRQLADWRAAVELARSLEAVDQDRIALWGSSLSGSHVVRLAADDASIAAVVVQVPVLDKSTGGMAREARAKMDREGISLGTLLWVTARSVTAGVYDAVRGLAGWSPRYIPVFDQTGHVAAFTDPPRYVAGTAESHGDRSQGASRRAGHLSGPPLRRLHRAGQGAASPRPSRLLEQSPGAAPPPHPSRMTSGPLPCGHLSACLGSCDDGNLPVQVRWVQALRAPESFAVVGGRLYVADDLLTPSGSVTAR